MRKISRAATDLVEHLDSAAPNVNRVGETRAYKLITPLFGGGVEPKKCDPVKIIRETSIRGQLRFWWRAMRGTGSLARMKQREQAIFGCGGKNNKHSAISIFVEKVIQQKPIVAFKVVRRRDRNGQPAFDRNNNPAFDLDANDKIAKYAAFPLLPDKNESKSEGWESEKVFLDVTFTVKISYPKKIEIKDKDGNISFTLNDVDKEISAAFWAWETFGGIGGRTRRGFGALQRTDVALPSANKEQENNVLTFIQNGLTEHLLQDGWDEDAEFPHLQSLMINNNFVLKPFNNANQNNCLSAWKDLICALQEFRQSRVEIIGRNKPSISHWSEPDQIRRLFPPRPPKTNYAHTPQHAVGKFPRAAFGLPIIFEFPQPNEPPKTELKPKEKDRLASPLILRPIACADGAAVGMALILKTPPLPALKLGSSPETISTELDEHDIAFIEPMQHDGNTTETDVLKMFLQTI